MAGRRLRDHVRKILTDGGVISADAIVTVSGLANTYTNYVVTFGTMRLCVWARVRSSGGRLSHSYTDARAHGRRTRTEEYMVQRYEGASTIYGPHTLR